MSVGSKSDKLRRSVLKFTEKDTVLVIEGGSIG